jgi:hypothetical protein
MTTSLSAVLASRLAGFVGRLGERLLRKREVGGTKAVPQSREMGRSNHPGESRRPQKNRLDERKRVPKWRVDREEVANALEEAELTDRMEDAEE